jgi:hypothetical protein
MFVCLYVCMFVCSYLLHFGPTLEVKRRLLRYILQHHITASLRLLVLGQKGDPKFPLAENSNPREIRLVDGDQAGVR